MNRGPAFLQAISLLLATVLLVGYIVAPPYSYLPQDEERVNNPVATSVFAGPIRAWRNWQTCGTVSRCNKLRCSMVEGGCTYLRAEGYWPMGLDDQVQKEGESDAAYQSRIAAWCEELIDPYEDWKQIVEAGERCWLTFELIPKAERQAQQPGAPAAPLSKSKQVCMPADVDTLISMKISVFITAGELIEVYERLCRVP